MWGSNPTFFWPYRSIGRQFEVCTPIAACKAQFGAQKTNIDRSLLEKRRPSQHLPPRKVQKRFKFVKIRGWGRRRTFLTDFYMSIQRLDPHSSMFKFAWRDAFFKQELEKLYLIFASKTLVLKC